MGMPEANGGLNQMRLLGRCQVQCALRLGSPRIESRWGSDVA